MPRVLRNANATNRLEDTMSKYDDIIDLPHHVSATRKPMPMKNRAAQFAPFAALCGHDDAINETARTTCPKIDLSEAECEYMSKVLSHALDTGAEVRVTYFNPDCRKSGGEYLSACGVVRKIDEYDRMLVFDSGLAVPLDNLYNIETGISGSES